MKLVLQASGDLKEEVPMLPDKAATFREVAELVEHFLFDEHATFVLITKVDDAL